MAKPNPVAPNIKTSTQNNEVAIATSFSDVNRYFQPKILKISKQSPPVLNVDVTEGTLILDRTAGRIYTVVNGVLKYVALT